MAGNAHANRHRRNLRGIKSPDCVYCQHRPKDAAGIYKNKNGHRHNPTHKRSGRRNPAANVAKKKQ